jgi:hypothetical protein
LQIGVLADDADLPVRPEHTSADDGNDVLLDDLSSRDLRQREAPPAAVRALALTLALVLSSAAAAAADALTPPCRPPHPLQSSSL